MEKSTTHTRRIKRLRPFESGIPEKEALEESIKIWTWLFNKGSKYKYLHPEFDIICRYKGWCPLCSSYYNSTTETERLNNGYCPYCSLALKDEWCLGNTSAYHEWVDIAKKTLYEWNFTEQVNAAGRLLSLLTDIYKEKYGEEYNPYEED